MTAAAGSPGSGRSRMHGLRSSKRSCRRRRPPASFTRIGATVSRPVEAIRRRPRLVRGADQSVWRLYRHPRTGWRGRAPPRRELQSRRVALACILRACRRRPRSLRPGSIRQGRATDSGRLEVLRLSLEARLSQADVDTLAHGVGLSGRPEPAPDLNRQIEEAVDDARRPDRTESWAIQTAMKRKPKLFSGKSQRAVAEMLRRRRLKACTE